MQTEAAVGDADQALRKARVLLRYEQERAAAGIGALLHQQDSSPLALALASLREGKQFEPTSDPKVVRRGIFKYDRALEEQRIEIADQLIRTIDPGPFEDPNY